jgi:hypothetical protein
MPEHSRKKKRPRDLNILVSEIVKIATEEEPETTTEDTRNPHAVALGLLVGQKGGKVRAQKLTPEQRSEISRKTAKARWNKKSD